jgi:hypothetical protein
MEGEPILKKTLYTVAVMVAAWTAFVGTVSIVAVLVTTHAVAAPQGEPVLVPAGTLQMMPPPNGAPPSMQHTPPNSHAQPI